MAHPEHDAALGRLAAARLQAPSAEVRLDAHPDPETWAAYADGGLVADEMAVLEAHLSACAACRRLVAALAPEPMVAASAPETAETPGPARVLPFRPRITWAWMSIAAGLLGAVTIWAVMRLQQPMAMSMAEQRAPASGAGSRARPPVEPMTQPSPTADAARPATAPAGPSGAAAPLRKTVPARTDELDRAKAGLDKTLQASDDARDRPAAFRETRANAPAAAAPAPAPRAEASGALAANEPVATATQPAQAATTVNTRTPASSEVHGPAVNAQQNLQQALNAQARAAQAAAQAQEKERAAAPIAPAETPRRAATRPQPAPRPAPPPPPPPEPQAVGEVAEIVSAPPPAAAGSGARRQGFGEAKREVAASRRAEPALADADALAPAITFGEPGGRLRWRIAGGHRIESSSDAGSTWTGRHPATPERLRAGSAPAIEAAWVVGDGGLVLRFAVPGSWTPVKRPTTATLVGVTASSADAARVTAEDGRVFETTDGGRSWTPAEGAGVPPR